MTCKKKGGKIPDFDPNGPTPPTKQQVLANKDAFPFLCRFVVVVVVVICHYGGRNICCCGCVDAKKSSLVTPVQCSLSIRVNQ